MIQNNDDLEHLIERFPGPIFGAMDDGYPRYRLFHASTSICSQKVRGVLIEADLSFYSHEMNIFAGENYDPSYVGLRAKACTHSGYALSTHHTGNSSVADTGCDACVVPTLIDVESEQVLIDSVNICTRLCERFAPRLKSQIYVAEINHEIAIVDSLPNYQLLASKVSQTLPGRNNNTFAASKVDRCNALINEHAEDPLLVAAYTAKREKESSANADLFTNEAISAAENSMQGAFLDLERRLSKSRSFLFSDSLTLADIFWATELIRAVDLGYYKWIVNSPKLSRYYTNLCNARSVRLAIIDWPDARIQLHP